MPSGRRRETQRGSGMRSVVFLSNAFLTLSDGFGRCCLGRVHFDERSLLSVRRGASQFQIRTHASPYGFGRMFVRHHELLEALWADSLSADDLRRCQAVKGDLAWQAEQELLAILMSLCVFRSKLVESTAQIVVQSDSLAALSVTVKLFSPKVCW